MRPCVSNSSSLAAMLLFSSSLAIAADPSSSLSADQARTIRSKVNVVSWDDGGEISHYSYLHTSEIFPVAIVKRRGGVRELPVHLRPDLGSFIIDENE